MTEDQYTILKYTGTAPGADSNTYTLFNSTTAFPAAGCHQAGGINSLHVSVKNSANGSLRLSRSEDRGLTWTAVDTAFVVPIDAVVLENVYRFSVYPYLDFKLEWVNGGSAQVTWAIDMALVPDRGAS